MVVTGVSKVVWLANALKAEPRALVLASLLLHQPQSISELSEALGMKLATTCHHVDILRSMELVVVEKTGRDSAVSIAPEWTSPLTATISACEALEGEDEDGATA